MDVIERSVLVTPHIGLAALFLRCLLKACILQICPHVLGGDDALISVCSSTLLAEQELRLPSNPERDMQTLKL